MATSHQPLDEIVTNTTPTSKEEWFGSLKKAKEDGKKKEALRRQHKIQRVAKVLRKKNPDCFQPIAVSIGPYHRHKPHLQRMEKLKAPMLWQYVEAQHCPMEELYHEVEKVAAKARECYAEDATKGMSDEDFTRMMFLDGCFFLQFITCGREGIQMSRSDRDCVERDLFLLENQLPFIVLKALSGSSDPVQKMMNSIRPRHQPIEEKPSRMRDFNCILPCNPQRKKEQSKAEREKEQSKTEGEPIHLLQLLRQSLLINPEDLQGKRSRNVALAAASAAYAAAATAANEAASASTAYAAAAASAVAAASSSAPASAVDVLAALSSAYAAAAAAKAATVSAFAFAAASASAAASAASAFASASASAAASAASAFASAAPPRRPPAAFAADFADFAAADAAAADSAAAAADSAAAAFKADLIAAVDAAAAHTYRSATELKKVGISFRKSQSHRFTDVGFRNNLGLLRIQGELRLPPMYVGDHTKSRLLNLVAYEMCADVPEEASDVTSYLCFLAALIDSAEDVKELRSKGILINHLGSDQQVADLFNEIGDGLVMNPWAYAGVNQKIEKHYKNEEFKGWVQEGLYTHFKAPWSGLSFVAALIILLLTFIQAFYAVMAFYATKNW